MDPRLQRRVQRYGWDRAAEFYEGYWQQQLAPAQDRLLELAALKPGDRVLDIACGTGLATFPTAAAIAPGGSVVGTDISDVMVDICLRLAKERGIDNATFERMEAESLKVKDDSFDAVLCALGLMYVTDFLGSVREMFRATKPGGRSVAAVWGQRDRCGWADIFPIVDARVNSDVCPMFFQLGSGNVLASLFEKAGFKDVSEDRIATTLEYDSQDAACGAAFAGGPVALAYSRFDDTTREEAHAEYLTSIEPFRTGNDYRIPGEFVVVHGVKS